MLNQLKQPLQEVEQLYFMHIPKTAGLSLIALLDQHYVDDEICPVHEGYKKFLEFSPEERGSFKFIRGHFPYKLVDELPRFPRLITFLRDPVKRTLSAFNQLRRNEEQGMSYFDEKIGDIDINQFLDHPTFRVTIPNVSVKYLNDILGKRWQKKKRVMSLSKAKERLETFDVIGLVEKFDESLALLSHTFGFLPILEFPRINVDPDRSSNNQIEQSVLDRIAEMNREEIELYEYGMRLFHKRLNKMEIEKKEDSVPEISRESTVHFDFKRVDPGRGWYPAERNPKFGIIRWSGPEPISYLDFPLAPERDLFIRFRVIGVIASLVLDSLVLEIGGQVIDLVRKPDNLPGAVVFEGPIPKAAIKNTGALTTLTFRISQTYFPGEFQPTREHLKRGILSRIRLRIWKKSLQFPPLPPTNPDVRKLGLCYNWLQIFPNNKR